MKYSQKWMVVPYVPKQQNPKTEFENELYSVLTEPNTNTESKLRMYNQILNKNYQPTHPIIPKADEQEINSSSIEKIIEKPKKTRKPKGFFTPITNSITKRAGIVTRNKHKILKEATPIKSLSPESSKLNLDETIPNNINQIFEEYQP